MSVIVQRRRDTAAECATYTGPPGELIVDLTNKRFLLQDGVTEGGIAMAKLSEVLNISGIATGSLLKVSSSGTLVAAVPGTDYLPASYAGLAAFLASAPTTEPSTSGVLWNNAGVLQIS